jgi:FkbM family methyltransferase
LTARRWLAKVVSRSPVHPVVAWGAEILQRYVDVSENFNDCDFETNGELFLLNRSARHWRLALDVGAHVGKWSEAVVLANPRCHVHSFEPSPDSYRRLGERLGSVRGVSIHNTGVGATEGTSQFYDYGAGSEISGYLSREATTGQPPQRVIELPVTTIDRFVRREGIKEVDFVKIDAEGFELPILRGMSESLYGRTISCCQFEYGGTWVDAGETLCRANEFLKQHGYTLFRLFPDRVRRIRYDIRRDEGYKYANYLAVEDETVLRRWGVPVD